MVEMIRVEGPGVHGQVAAHPVSVREYRAFLRATGHPPGRLARYQGAVTAPVTRITRADALAYCAWQGQNEGRAYRLPSMAELLALFAGHHELSGGPDGWPADNAHSLHDFAAEREAACEWTSDSETAPQYGVRPDRTLAVIFYPPWLRPGANATQAHASLDPTQGYSFVGFRVAL